MRYFFAAFALASTLVVVSTLIARAQGIDDGRAREAALYDAGPDPVVASDHAPRPALDLPATAPADDDPPPSLVDRALDIAGPIGRGALGGIACLGVAWLLARARERWGWLRRGWAGNAAATAYAALATFGAVVAIGGSVGVGLTAIGGAMVAGMGLERDPETARVKREPTVEDVPT